MYACRQFDNIMLKHYDSHACIHTYICIYIHSLPSHSSMIQERWKSRSTLMVLYRFYIRSFLCTLYFTQSNVGYALGRGEESYTLDKKKSARQTWEMENGEKQIMGNKFGKVPLYGYIFHTIISPTSLLCCIFLLLTLRINNSE